MSSLPGGAVGRGGKVVVCGIVHLDPVVRLSGETAGEGRTPVMVRVDDGGVYRRRFLVGVIDVVAPSLHFSMCSMGNP